MALRAFFYVRFIYKPGLKHCLQIKKTKINTQKLYKFHRKTGKKKNLFLRFFISKFKFIKLLLAVFSGGGAGFIH